MQGTAYLGVHLNSGGCIADLKQLIQTDYAEFERQFDEAKTMDGRSLSEAMEGRTRQENLDMAWDLYARAELEKKGHTEKFERAYIELEEFEMFLGSMSVFHFGARYPCFPEIEEIPDNWWHARLHFYVGNMLVRKTEAAAAGAEQFEKENRYRTFANEPVADNTIDLSELPQRVWRGLRTARLYLTQ